MPLASILSASALATALESLGSDSSPALAAALAGFSGRIAMYFPLAVPMSPFFFAASASRINLSISSLGREGSTIAATTWFTGGLLLAGVGVLTAEVSLVVSDPIWEALVCSLPAPSALLLAASALP